MMSTLPSKLPTFDWYAIVSEMVPIEQGDLLDNLPIVILPASVAELSDKPIGEEIEEPLLVERFDVVVMTQSCDLARFDGRDEVILCPRHSYPEVAAADRNLSGPSGWGNLRRGRVIGAHILNKCDIANHEFDYQVVDLNRVFTVPFSVAKRIALNQGGRVRLLPPYREHLAQAFARQFMRVGLPLDLPEKYPY